jgi:hypothetical protein
MANLIIGTDKVNEDEPCVSLKEQNEPSPFGGRHRYQIIRVLRGQKIVEFRHDLGKAENFKANAFIIPGAGDDNIPVHKVGELVEIANYLRTEKPRHPEKPMQDLLAGYYYMMEAKRKAKA